MKLLQLPPFLVEGRGLSALARQIAAHPIQQTGAAVFVCKDPPDQQRFMVEALHPAAHRTDVLAGSTTMNGLPFSLAERSPYQEDFDYTLLSSYTKFNDAVKYMGKIVAKNHAIADKDYDATLISYSMDKEITDVINGAVAGLKTETLNFALNYAAQVKQDYADFVSAKNSGAILY